MTSDEILSAGIPIYRIVSAHPLPALHVRIAWENGRVEEIDLSEHLRNPVFSEVLAADAAFNSVVIDDYGWAISWPDHPRTGIPSTLLISLADAQQQLKS